MSPCPPRCRPHIKTFIHCIIYICFVIKTACVGPLPHPWGMLKYKFSIPTVLKTDIQSILTYSPRPEKKLNTKKQEKNYMKGIWGRKFIKKLQIKVRCVEGH